MNQDTDRPFRTLSFQLLWLIFVLTMLPAEYACVVVLRGDLISGQTSSPAVVIGLGQLVDRRTAPEYFWGLMAIYCLSVTATIVLCVFQFYVISVEDKRRGSTLAEKVILWGSGCVYFALFVMICRYVYLGIKS